MLSCTLANIINSPGAMGAAYSGFKDGCPPLAQKANVEGEMACQLGGMQCTYTARLDACACKIRCRNPIPTGVGGLAWLRCAWGYLATNTTCARGVVLHVASHATLQHARVSPRPVTPGNAR